MPKPIASISLDLDNHWSYMKNHGTEGWEEFPSYLEVFVPMILEELEALGIKITFFIVGQDAALEKNHPYLKMIADGGHEIANHSFRHETWLQRYTEKELMEEIEKAHEAIFHATGKEPIGFRGPGFTWNRALLNILAEKGYSYDASTFPTFIGPLARRMYYKTARLSEEEKAARKDLFGKFSDGFQRLRPYIWKLDHGKRLLEIPVTTMPVFRIPMHLTYLVYLSSISEFLMMAYLHTAVFLCRLTRTRPSFLIHPLDILSGDQVTGLDGFPGMEISSTRKVRIFRKVMGLLKRRFTLVPMEALATRYSDTMSGQQTKQQGAMQVE